MSAVFGRPTGGPRCAILTADSVEAQYVCVDRGGTIAPGQGTEFQNVGDPVQNIQPRNGLITFTNVTIPPPETPSAREVCPKGNWIVNLLHLTYDGCSGFGALGSWS